MALPAQGWRSPTAVLDLAGFIFQEAVGSQWWASTRVGRRFFRSNGEILLGAMKKWTKSLTRAIGGLYGLQAYRTLSYATESDAGVSFFLRDGDGSLLAYIHASNIVELRRGRVKMLTPATLTAALAVLERRYGRFYDYLLPRYRRTIEARGYLMVAVKNLAPSPELGEEWMARLAATVYEERRRGLRVVVGQQPGEGEAPGTGALARFTYGLSCYEAGLVFEDYKAKYFLLIPPFIVWKWGHVISLTTIYNRVRSESLCDRVMAALAKA